jgi:hypothetical protein
MRRDHVAPDTHDRMTTSQPGCDVLTDRVTVI